jgi:tetratricopeptide (TPR) repeat protein
VGKRKSPEDLEARGKIAAAWAAIFTLIVGASFAGLLPSAVVVIAPVLALAGLIAALWCPVQARSAGLVREAAERDAAAAARKHAIDVALRTAVCPAADVRPSAMGVDRVDPRVLERALIVAGGQLAYVHREVDARLREHLARARDGQGPALVCLHGPSKAGKSRSMLEAIQAALPGAALVMPDRTRENLKTVVDCEVLQQAAGSDGGVVVLWLDDLEGFVRLGNSGLDPNGLVDLKRKLPTLVVAATAGGRGLVTSSEPGKLHAPLNDLLAAAAREDLLAGLTTAGERKALAAVVSPELAEEMQDGLGAVAVSGAQLVGILVSQFHPRDEGGQRCAEGAALTWAAIAAYRLGVTEPIAEDVLRRLFACYTTTPTDAAFEAALQWATRPLYAQVALLRSHGTALAPYDYLVQHAPDRVDSPQRCAWRELMESSPPQGLFALGVSAYLRGATDDAIEANRRADQRGHAAGASNLGVLLADRGDLGGAEDAWRGADQRGHAAGASNLGVLLADRGDLGGAEDAWRRADQRGHAAGASNLGVLLADRGDLGGAEDAWRRTDQRGDPAGAYHLGVLLAERGDLEGAEAAWRRAADSSDEDFATLAQEALSEADV